MEHDPPTSGPHYGEPAIWGSYDSPVQLAQAVHNLEHGGVFILYGRDVPEADVDEMWTWFYKTDDPNGLLLAPLPRHGDKITLGAWTAPTRDRHDARAAAAGSRVHEFDEDAFSAFLDEYRFKGPERFPPEH